MANEDSRLGSSTFRPSSRNALSGPQLTPPPGTQLNDETQAEASTSKKSVVGHQDGAVKPPTPLSNEANQDDDATGCDDISIVYFTIPVQDCPSPPSDQFTPPPQLECQPFDPVKTPSPPPELRIQVEQMKAHALANPQQLATPIDTSPPRSTPPLYSPKFPPSPTLIERHPSTWIEEILVSVERRRANLKSELIDAKADVNEALAQSFRALTMLKEMIGSGGLVGLLEVLEKEDNEMRERENEKRMAKGKAKAKITEDVKKNAADAAKEEKKKGTYLSLLRLLVRMVGLTMVRRMIMDARESTVRHHGDFDDGEDDDEEGDGGSEGESEDEGGDDDDNEGGDGGGHGGGDAGDDGDDEEEEDGGRDEELSDGDGDTQSEPSTNNVSKLQDDVDASSPTKTPDHTPTHYDTAVPVVLQTGFVTPPARQMWYGLPPGHMFIQHQPVALHRVPSLQRSLNPAVPPILINEDFKELHYAPHLDAELSEPDSFVLAPVHFPRPVSEFSPLEWRAHSPDNRSSPTSSASSSPTRSPLKRRRDDFDELDGLPSLSTSQTSPSRPFKYARRRMDLGDFRAV